MKSYLVFFAFVCGMVVAACGSQSSHGMAVQTAASEVPTVEPGVSISLPEGSQIKNFCPSDMLEIQGEFCPNLHIKCLYNVDIDGHRMAGPANPMYSCGEFEQPTICLSKPSEMIKMHFCIDRYEWPNKPGVKPRDWMSWYSAKKAVESIGKRLCTSREWQLAAMGPNYHPLPYGDGYHRTHDCNIDRKYSDVYQMDEFKALGINRIDVFQSRHPDDKMSQALRLFIKPSGSMPNCHSDFGVYDMSGNLDEEVINESGKPWVSGLVGGHYWHVRQNSYSMTTVHGPTFGWYEVSTRGCMDIKELDK